MHWIALQPQPEAQPPDGLAGLADVWSALGWWALQFTPRVARLDDAVLLEVSASERLWGGRARLRHLLLESNQAPALIPPGVIAIIFIANRFSQSAAKFLTPGAPALF